MASARTHPLIYLIAGEHSGDLLGARLMASLKARDPHIAFAGIGGPRMQAEGLQTLLPMSELALMGFIEILPHIPRMLGYIRRTVNDIIQQNPDMVVTIDSPGFCFRVVRLLRARASKLPFLAHYVAPSVWAYKPGRAKKIAALYDHLFCLLPFEPPYFEREGLTSSFIGHPVVWEWREPGDGKVFRQTYAIKPEQSLLCLLPGSRRGELVRHLPLFKDTVALLAQRLPTLALVMPVPAEHVERVKVASRDWALPVIVINSESEKKNIFAASNVALAKSGTVTLELSLAHVPMVVTYKVNALTAWLMRRMIRTKFVNLVNIVAGHAIIPELIQEQATPQSLSHAVLQLLEHPDTAKKQIEHSVIPLRNMGLGEAISPSDKAAERLLSHLQ